MADVLPLNFPVPVEPALVNFDSSDLLTQVGYVTFYGFKDEADAYKLNRIPLGSNTVSTQFNGPDIPDSLVGECAFDTRFGVAQRVLGELFVTCTYYVNAPATQTATGYIKCRVLHVSGVTETLIGTQQTADTLSESADTEGLSKRTTFTFSVDKFFNVNEILRVEVELYNSGGGNSYIGLAHDGENRALTITGDNNGPSRTDFIVNVPFDLRGKI
jgi:hypothetical protein